MSNDERAVYPLVCSRAVRDELHECAARDGQDLRTWLLTLAYRRRVEQVRDAMTRPLPPHFVQ